MNGSKLCPNYLFKPQVSIRALATAAQSFPTSGMDVVLLDTAILNSKEMI